MLGQLKWEHHGREMESVWEVERDGGGGGGVRILWEKKKSRYAQSAWQSVTLRLCPCSRKGKGERAAGCGASSLCPSLELAAPDSSSSSPLYSVLSSRCQEVAQCLFCFLLKVCVILHISFCLFVSFRPPELEEQTGSQKVSGSFVCFILSPVTWLSHLKASGSSWSLVTKTTHTQGTVYGRIRDTLHYRVHP